MGEMEDILKEKREIEKEIKERKESTKRDENAEKPEELPNFQWAQTVSETVTLDVGGKEGPVEVDSTLKTVFVDGEIVETDPRIQPLMECNTEVAKERESKTFLKEIEENRRKDKRSPSPRKERERRERSPKIGAYKSKEWRVREERIKNKVAEMTEVMDRVKEWERDKDKVRMDAEMTEVMCRVKDWEKEKNRE